MRDRDVRAVLVERLNASYSEDPDTRIVHEMDVWSGSARIDIAVINGELVGYEIKSDRDDLSRLSRQVEVYNHVFDRLCLVVGSQHTDEAISIVPKWWGVWEAKERKGGVIIRILRKGKKNSSPTPLVLVDLLRKHEVIKILDSKGLAKGVKSKGYTFLQKQLVEHFTFNELALMVRNTLKERKDWLP